MSTIIIGYVYHRISPFTPFTNLAIPFTAPSKVLSVMGCWRCFWAVVYNEGILRYIKIYQDISSTCKRRFLEIFLCVFLEDIMVQS